MSSRISLPRGATQSLLIPAAGVIIALVAGCAANDSTSSSSSTSEASSASSNTEAAPGNGDSSVERLTATVVNQGKFNPEYFTQGLEVDKDGSLLVGTGQFGESGIYRVDPATMEVKTEKSLDKEFFGEGITRAGDTVWQLTWKAGTAIKRDAQTLDEMGRVDYPGEGWGLCAFDDELIMSDGTDELRHLDPDTFEERSRTSVTLDGQPVEDINELECADGQVYANVWMTEDIYRIDPASGEVTATIDTAALKNNAAPDPDNVLNGIAHIPGTDQFYVTGKRWPDLYTVTFTPAS